MTRRRSSLVANSAVRGEQLIAGVRELAGNHDVIGDVRGRGLMIGIELLDHGGRSAGELVQATRMAAAEAGLLTLPCGATGQVLRLIPALVVSEDEITTGLSMLDDALAKATAG